MTEVSFPLCAPPATRAHAWAAGRLGVSIRGGCSWPTTLLRQLPRFGAPARDGCSRMTPHLSSSRGGSARRRVHPSSAPYFSPPYEELAALASDQENHTP